MMRRVAIVLLLLIFVVLLGARYIAPHSYATQFRDAPNAKPCRMFPLGTDDLGRDRLSRLLYGGQISLLLAPAAALVSVAFALAISLLAGCLGPWCERTAIALTDLALSLPWLFALLAVRAILPLNAPPVASVVVTFGMLGLLGCTGPSRVMLAAVKRHLRSDFVLLARASGCRRGRLALIHLAPNLLPLVEAQFLIKTPTFLLAEATLGLLGLGVPEPLPSWGSLLQELENLPSIATRPWILAPLAMLVVVVGLFHLVVPADQYSV
jgi:peptide/nickel transport system permease protein